MRVRSWRWFWVFLLCPAVLLVLGIVALVPMAYGSCNKRDLTPVANGT